MASEGFVDEDGDSKLKMDTAESTDAATGRLKLKGFEASEGGKQGGSKTAIAVTNKQHEQGQVSSCRKFICTRMRNKFISTRHLPEVCSCRSYVASYSKGFHHSASPFLRRLPWPLREERSLCQ